MTYAMLPAYKVELAAEIAKSKLQKNLSGKGQLEASTIYKAIDRLDAIYDLASYAKIDDEGDEDQTIRMAVSVEDFKLLWFEYN